MKSSSKKQAAAGRGLRIFWFVVMLALLAPASGQAQVGIATTALPAGNTSSMYYSVLAASGGASPYAWTLDSGQLPPGLTLSSSGVISGVPTSVTAGTPPIATPFTVRVTDSASSTTTQSYRITILTPGSHSLVMNQVFSGGNGSTSSPYYQNYLEIFNAGPVAVDLQNWTIQYGQSNSSSMSFSQAKEMPLGSLDAYSSGATGGADGLGNYPAFPITYSSAFTASNCNPATGNSQVNADFPANHCWLNPGQYLLVAIAPNTTSGGLSATTAPITPSPDLDLTLAANAGPVVGSPYVGYGSAVTLTDQSTGAFALVNGVPIGVSCSAGTPSNPQASLRFSPLTADFVSYFAQLSAGGKTQPACWEGSTASYGFAVHVSSSGKNTEALIRSAGNGVINASVTGATAPAGTLLSTSAALTPCGDTDNNLSDFAPIKIGKSGQANWVLHNSQQMVTAALLANSTTQSYSPAACPSTAGAASLSAIGPVVSASVDQPTVAQNAGGGVITETLTVKVTPAANPTALLFNVNADLSGISGANSSAPLGGSSQGVPDDTGNVVYQETFTMPTAAVGAYTIPITVIDDAYRSGLNANAATPLPVSVMVSASCQPPTANAQSVQMTWNTAQSITLSGQLGGNCESNDTLVYAIQNQPAHGTLSALNGNQVVYTAANGFSGADSFSFYLMDTSNAEGALTGTAATVTITVSATGVVPALTLNCPSPTYDGNAHSCTASLSPYVSGTTAITYAGSPAAPTNAGQYAVAAAFTAASDSSQDANASGALIIAKASPSLTLSCPAVAYDGNSHACTASTVAVGGGTVSGTTAITYNGSTTAPSDGGTYSVVATFTSGDGNYTDATQTATLSITEPAITITANDQTMTYGGATPVLTYTISPSVPLQTAPTCTSAANAATPVGAYAGVISCTGAAKTGCTFIYVNGSMTVQPAPAVVTANDQSITVGSAIPALTYSTSPSTVDFTTTPACTTTATSSSPAGTYPITCSGGVSANYTLSYVAGTLTVNVAPTTPNGIPALASISPMVIASGSANTTISISGTGFVADSVANWNGTALTTTYGSATLLTAVVPRSSLASVGTADVTVYSPAPGGGTSSSMTVSIDTPASSAAFTVTPASSAISVTHGQAVQDALAISNLSSKLYPVVACYNLPSQAYCSYDAGTLTLGTQSSTPAGVYPVLVVFSISGSQTASLRSAASGGALLCGILACPLALLIFWRGKRFRIYALFLVALAGAMILTSCGGSSSQTQVVSSSQSSFTLNLTVK